MNKNTVDINGILDRIIEETGIDQKKLSVKLGYNESYLSQARQKGTKKLYSILENYEKEFRKSKNLNPLKPPQKLDNDNWKDKYIALLEEHLVMKKALDEELSVLKVKVDQLQDKLAERISGKLTEVEQVLEEVRLNQQVMYSVQDAYFDHWLDALPDKEAVRLAIQQKAREGAKKYRKQGIRL